MPAELLFQFTEFAVQAAILLVLLSLIIRFQKLNQRFPYRLLKLMGAAALASGLDMVPYAGHFLAVPVLLVSVKKITRMDYVEALFPVALFLPPHFWAGPLPARTTRGQIAGSDGKYQCL